MKRLFFALAALAAAPIANRPPTVAAPARVLFIGNSLTGRL
jgi:hypothetical protein